MHHYLDSRAPPIVLYIRFHPNPFLILREHPLKVLDQYHTETVHHGWETPLIAPMALLLKTSLTGRRLPMASIRSGRRRANLQKYPRAPRFYQRNSMNTSAITKFCLLT